MWYPAGSRDPEVNADPHSFDITREEPAHMAFGGGGRHFCLGRRARPARAAGRLRGDPARGSRTSSPAATPEHLRSNWANALTALPIEFKPGSKELN